jgi:hypothetical protein
MSLGMTLTTLQQTVNLIRGLRGMAAVAMVAVGHGSGLLGSGWLGSGLPGYGLLGQPGARFAADLPIHGRDLFKSRSGKGSLARLPLA